MELFWSSSYEQYNYMERNKVQHRKWKWILAWGKIQCYAENTWLGCSNNESLLQGLFNCKQDSQTLSSGLDMWDQSNGVSVRFQNEIKLNSCLKLSQMLQDTDRAKFYSMIYFLTPCVLTSFLLVWLLSPFVWLVLFSPLLHARGQVATSIHALI